MKATPEMMEALDVGDDYAKAFATQMLESLAGNPVTVFVETPGQHKGSTGRYAYSQTPSLNADWFREIDGDDAKKIKKTLAAIAGGTPLVVQKNGTPSWIETRSILKELAKAREHGFSATVHGRPWIGEIPPEHEWKALMSKRLDIPVVARGRLCTDTKGLCRATFTPKKPHRVYLALPEEEYRKLRAKAREVHASPNRYLAHVIAAFHEIDEQASREF